MGNVEGTSGHETGEQEANSKALTAVQAALTWAYEAALNGIPGIPLGSIPGLGLGDTPNFGTLDDLVDSYLTSGVEAEDAIDSLVNWQIGKAAAAGFITNLGGILTLPVAIPANLASVLFIQFRVIAGIAKLRGYDVHSDQVKTLCVACLAGSAASDILKDVGIQIGTKLSQTAIKQIAGSTLVSINQAVGFRLLTKAGQNGVINISKVIPFIGGFIGGAFDAITTSIIAQAAKSVFTPLTPEAHNDASDADEITDTQPFPSR